VQRTAIVGGNLALPDGTLTSGAIVISGGRIDVVSHGTSLDLDGFNGEVIDAAGRIVTAGLIDIHMHGARGRSFDEADQRAARQIARHCASVGVTTVQATLVSASTSDLREQLATLKPLVRNPGRHEATIAGIHLEGPFLAVSQSGAHDPSVLRSPTQQDRALLLHAAGELTMITLAPEVPEVLDLVQDLTAAGVVVAIGHSNARERMLTTAQSAGARHITHLWSGQSAMIREGPWRVPGLLEGALASTGLTAEIIADGKHLPPALLEIARRCLGPELVVVSDATAGTGMPDGYTYQLGQVRCRVHGGVGMVDGTASFGGSTTALDGMLRYLVHELEWPLAEVVRMMTTTPARILGIEGNTGSLRVGRAGDVVIWNDDLEPVVVVVRGTVVRESR
jgi:N-acetylglucosamine-6-phosphate deacetylase